MLLPLCAMVALLIGMSLATAAEVPPSPPDDFPRFRVPGQENAMESLRALYWLHYPGSGPKATLWDEWLTPPSLWPAVETGGQADAMRREWARVLDSRVMDPEGYVATHQHASIAHQLGWPFPFWNQGQGGAGWHFSFKDTVGPPWRQGHLNTPDGWSLQGARAEGVQEDGWAIVLTEPFATVTTPPCRIDTQQAPFLQLRWRAAGLGDAQPYVEWTTREAGSFSPERRLYFDAAEGDRIWYTMIPLYRHPRWGGEITRVRIGFGNATPGATVTIQAFFTQYDTRHNINSQNFVRGCIAYFRWTRDLAFLRRNIGRMRMALRYVMKEHHALSEKVVVTDWVGHDGRPAIVRRPDGSKVLRFGHGIGNNYWDLLPFGHKDAYATIHYYDALNAMADIEADVRAHPEWGIPLGVLAFEPEELRRHAAEVKETGNRLFWNRETGRFTAGVDADGKQHDYGFTFLNLEAIYYDFATPEHARSILAWISGDRRVPGDTAQGPDIYHWRFAPRATTRRNLEYYGWFWSSPESIPFGAQIQDGGAVLGFSYHDLMARLKVRGPDDAWARLREILRWFDEVQAAGGYRSYYNGQREGTLQGGGTAGGLGLDCEFFESVLVPQVMLFGFLGFQPTADGFRIEPNLPTTWPELSIDRIRYQGLVLSIRATRDQIEIRKSGRSDEPCFVHLPKETESITLLRADGTPLGPSAIGKRRADGAYPWHWADATQVRIRLRKPGKPRPSQRPR